MEEKRTERRNEREGTGAGLCLQVREEEAMWCVITLSDMALIQKRDPKNYS
jgi:hypothetical protein